MSIFNNSKSKFASSLIEARKAACLTGAEVAKKLGKAGQTTVSMWENDKSFPAIDDFVELCNIYNVTPNDLLGFSEDGKPSLAQQLEFVTAERDGIRNHRDRLLEKLGNAPHWVAIESPEDAPAGDELVLWDGCDLSVDFTDTEVEYGTTFFSNGTEATHYLANLMPPPQSEAKPS